MEISNQKRSKRIKQAFNLTGILVVLIGLTFLWLKMDVLIYVTVGVFIAFLGIFQFLNLCYVYFSSDNGKILIRYYPIISIFKTQYDSVEFQHQALLDFQIEKSMGFSDLLIEIKTKRGIAQYPAISLTGLRKVEVDRIISELTEIRRNNRKRM